MAWSRPWNRDSRACASTSVHGGWLYNNVHMFVFLLKGMLLIKVNDAMIIRGSTSLELSVSLASMVNTDFQDSP